MEHPLGIEADAHNPIHNMEDADTDTDNETNENDDAVSDAGSDDTVIAVWENNKITYERLTPPEEEPFAQAPDNPIAISAAVVCYQTVLYTDQFANIVCAIGCFIAFVSLITLFDGLFVMAIIKTIQKCIAGKIDVFVTVMLVLVTVFVLTIMVVVPICVVRDVCNDIYNYATRTNDNNNDNNRPTETRYRYEWPSSPDQRENVKEYARAIVIAPFFAFAISGSVAYLAFSLLVDFWNS